MEKKDKRNNRTLVGNMVKAVVAFLVSAFWGYLIYMLTINSENLQSPESAGSKTVIFSLIMFVCQIFIFVKIFSLPTSDARKLDEKSEIRKLQIESSYTLDYKAYFINQVKMRLWGVFVIIFLLQLPLVMNFAMVSSAPGFYVYNSPISVYKLYMPSMFLYELFGNAWFFAPVAYTLIFATAFLITLYHSQKKWIPPKPSWA